MSHLFTIREVSAALGVEPGCIQGFIQREWVTPAGGECRSGHEEKRPVGSPEHYFDDCDLARARLILELRAMFEADDESILVILKRIDHIHFLRDRLQQARTHTNGRA